MSDIIDIIRKKRDKNELTKKEIDFIIEKYTSSDMREYQMSAFIMASFINGLSKEETQFLTESMFNSGKSYNFENIEGIKVDKHSTGGVGDKVSFVLSPLLSVLGFKNPMMAGRGLGYTGGTIDKLESLNGYNPEQTPEKINRVLKDEGAVIFSQSDEIAPADKKLYSLRDVTATVESIPLITSSIVSKKMAEDISTIVYDVKIGNGAFMDSYSEAKKLARWLVSITRAVDINSKAVISDMNQVLGFYAGNALELYEVLNFLSGNIEVDDLKKISIKLAYEIASVHEKISENKFIKKCEKLIQSGEVYNKFKNMLLSMGASKNSIKEIQKGNFINKVFEIRSKKSGIITGMNTQNIGKIVNILGGGRNSLGESINHSVGIKVCKKINDNVEMGDTLAKIYYENEYEKKKAIDIFNSSIEFGDRYEERQLIYEVI